LGKGTAKGIISKLEELRQDANEKLLVADLHSQLASWDEHGSIIGSERRRLALQPTKNNQGQ